MNDLINIKQIILIMKTAMKALTLTFYSIVFLLLNLPVMGQENYEIVERKTSISSNVEKISHVTNLESGTLNKSFLTTHDSSILSKSSEIMAGSWTCKNLKSELKNILEYYAYNQWMGDYKTFGAISDTIKNCFILITGDFYSDENTRSVSYDDVYLTYDTSGVSCKEQLQEIGHFDSGWASDYNNNWILYDWLTFYYGTTWVTSEIKANGNMLKLNFLKNLIEWNRNPYPLAFALYVHNRRSAKDFKFHLGNSVFELNVLSTSILAVSPTNGIKVFPNPTKKILFVTNIDPKATISIFDLHGKMLISKQIINNRIDISSLTSGIYLVKISDNNEILTRKFIKQ